MYTARTQVTRMCTRGWLCWPRHAPHTQWAKPFSSFLMRHGTSESNQQRGGLTSPFRSGPERRTLILPSVVLAGSQPPPETARGQVMAAQANYFRVRLDPTQNGTEDEGPLLRDSGPTLLCKARALLSKLDTRVIVGDRVVLTSIDWINKSGTITQVLPRTSLLQHPLVANVSHLFLVFSVATPPFDPGPATRYLVAGEAADMDITVVLNKVDLVPEEQSSALCREVESWGYPVVLVSTVTGQGLDQLQDSLGGTTAVLAGPSGAGKSSIINALADRVSTKTSEPNLAVPVMQSVGDVSPKLGRGRHTTRTVSLLPLGTGAVVDTPGFNQPSVEGIDPRQLADFFPEIQDAIEEDAMRCAFSNCQHLSEPGCLVRGLSVGTFRRYPLYAQLHAECEAASKNILTRIVKRKLRQGNTRRKNRAGGRVELEAKLDTKAHRRQSRKSANQQLQKLVRDELARR